MSQIDNTFIQLRARLNAQGIKLWEEPYYFEGVGSIEAEMERLSEELSRELGISVSNCKCALAELQDSALRKLAARREYNETGLATFNVRRVDSQGGTANMVEVKCSLSDLGAELHQQIAIKLQLGDASQVKCISAGRIVTSHATLDAQGLRNNQQLMVIVGRGDAKEGELYERIRKIKADVEAVVDSERRFVEMEDQDGNAVFLPPDENRSLLMGMGYCEKARAAMHREHYDEALLLLLEADEMFGHCNSKFLESVDNYALLNLDIVWCYLCLKNITQLPDAERRLAICERSFRRSYGENYNRLYALKGNACPERALIMRLHLLQGVIFFHQNRRDEAYERLELAGSALAELKVNDDQLTLLVEMGFDVADARLALRSCSGNVDRAVQFIQQRREKLQAARLTSSSERRLNRRLGQTQEGLERDWVNPRSVCRLMEMGYDRRMVVEALKRTKNDVPQALDLLQQHSEELRANLPVAESADAQLLDTLQQLGFDLGAAETALETTQNDMDRAVEFLLKSFGSEQELVKVMECLAALTADLEAPSTSGVAGRPLLPLSASKLALVQSVLGKAKSEMESYNAYKRFNADLPENEQDYLDLPLVQEEQILIEYRHLLEH